MDAVGADQDIGCDRGAVGEARLDMVAAVGQTDKTMAEMDAFGRQAGGDDGEQIGAMDRQMRRPVKLLAERVERRRLQRAPVVPPPLPQAERAYPFAIEPGGEAKPVEDAGR